MEPYIDYRRDVVNAPGQIDPAMAAGDLRRSATPRYSPQTLEGMLGGPIEGEPTGVTQLRSLLTNGSAAFSGNKDTPGLAPGESFSVSPGQVSLQGTNAGINMGTDGSFGITYSPDSRNWQVGVKGTVPRDGVEGRIKADFKVGRKRAPYGQGYGNPVPAVDSALGVQPITPATETAAQRYLSSELQKYKNMTGADILPGTY